MGFDYFKKKKSPTNEVTSLLTEGQDAIERGKDFSIDTLEMLKELAEKVTKGTVLIRIMAVIGGVSLLVLSLLEVFEHLFTFKLNDVLIDIYSGCIGIAAIVLESNRYYTRFGPKIKSFITKNFHFLDFVTGRGFLYFIGGSLRLMTGEGDIATVVGFLMCAIGFIYFFVGKRTFEKLKSARCQLYPTETIQKTFKKADKNSDGGITIDEFGEMIEMIGLHMSKKELQIAFVFMDKNDADDIITFEEFEKFWNSSEFDQTSFFV
eukprot:CAMPEP_0184857914 /NCGR_PEP_ID=MMETSP0580-20130426/3056_1 /TAXON_ID=1118495 /ORGANISM="Dactyliosolen fragilissimus" /LENGTH=263 /DNA_ID=CAMNT_0027353779 /DNA_START=1 /DNA_END=792 /DNA_ORIENTATION=+